MVADQVGLEGAAQVSVHLVGAGHGAGRGDGEGRGHDVVGEPSAFPAHREQRRGEGLLRSDEGPHRLAAVPSAAHPQRAASASTSTSPRPDSALPPGHMLLMGGRCDPSRTSTNTCLPDTPMRTVTGPFSAACRTAFPTSSPTTTSTCPWTSAIPRAVNHFRTFCRARLASSACGSIRTSAR